MLHRSFIKGVDCCVIFLTSTEVSEHVVALLGEGHLVDGVTDVIGLQEVACVFASFTAVGETLDVTVEPVHHVRTWTERGQADVRGLQNSLEILRNHIWIIFHSSC